MRPLSRIEALERADAIALETVRVELDLRGAGEADAVVFPVRSILRLTARTESTFLDVAGEVEALRIDGEEREVRHEDERLALEGLPIGREVEVEVSALCRYSRTGEGLHRYVDPEDSRVYLYTQFEPNDAHRAWPCFDQPDLKARWTFVVDAPADWVVVSNGAEESVEEVEGGTRRTFAETRPLSSYITAVVAGEWAVVDGGVWSGGAADSARIDVPLRLLCRSALAPSMDSEDLLAVTRAGLDFYHSVYGTTYPWGTYDQVFVPEYNLGAMENPGCVTFTETYLSREAPTFAERQKRANTILHEMCHMWFGDLVTPKWWDDLWLKESFAENQGAMAAARATEYAGERAAFAVGRKVWAYEQDQMPTTHPIAADIPDVGAAKTNFDGITYAKGAAVLNQLVAWVGEDAFFAGAREYFRRHAFSSATLSDLVACLEESSGEDLGGWVDAWLRTSGPAVLAASWEVDEAGAVRAFRLVDEGPEPGIRPHRLAVSTWAVEGGTLVQRNAFDVRMTGASADIDPEGVLAHPGAAADLDLVVVNDGDLTYAVSRLDARSTDTALAFLPTCPDLTTRCVVWASLWNALRDGLLDPRRFIPAALRAAEAEADETLADRLVAMARDAILSFLPGSARPEFARDFERAAIRIARSAPADRARTWTRALIALLPTAADEEAIAVVRGIADASTDTGWLARAALAARGLLDRDALEAAYAAAPTGEAARHLVRARAALPDADALEEAWALITGPGAVNDRLSAAFAGLAMSTRTGESVVPRALDALESFWNSRTIGLGIRYVRGALLGGVDLEDEASRTDRVDRVDAWLAAHPDAPAPLARLLVEHADDARRSLRVQERWAKR